MKAKEQAQLVSVAGFDIWLSRKRIKNMNLRIKPPDGRIEVSAPMHMPMRDIERFITQKQNWIRRQQLAVVNSPAFRAEQASAEEQKEWKAVVSACVPPLVQAWEPIMGVHATKLVYRNMKSRWGSCQPATGRICINTRLALYPPECLEYVVVHELCHLLEGGHGKRFHKLMDSFMPDWRDRRAKLR
ncbi:SprT family zinc-dependent metalloprotease [Adlercreutzia sp. ZJ304]|uniref:M48 family metallopeptidase n=1 Tax=Adlercreutzia sp. ZJ304 TaxID=2709791 RepID=UPI0013EC1025|nr:SprT family zinc-dependent metalloprotease [Adlercreutzia sp. ZJ304]